jgi:hypothetical protein
MDMIVGYSFSNIISLVNIIYNLMFINKPLPFEKRGNSNKKVHRRVVTEIEEMPQHTQIQK